MDLVSLIQMFLVAKEAAGCRPRTLEFYSQQLRYFRAYLETLPNKASPQPTIYDLTSDNIESYLARRRKEVKARSVHAAWRAIHALCSWLEGRGERFPGWKNPTTVIIPPKMPRQKLAPAEREDIIKMLETCNTHKFLDDRDRAVILVLSSSGLRASELLGLTLRDVELKRGLLHVREGKGGYERVAIINPKAKLALAEYIGHLGKVAGDDPLWQTPQRTGLTLSGLTGLLRRRRESAGLLNSMNPHSFRRRWASDMVPKLGPWVVQALGGWHSFESVRPYITLTTEDLIKACEEAES